MALGTMVGVKGNRWGRNQQRGKHSYESDEEYKVGEDEDCDDSDGYCSLDSDESEEEEEALERVSRSRKTRTMPRKETKKSRKRRKVPYSGMDDDEEDEDELISLGRKGKHIKEHQEKKGVSYIEEDDEDDSKFLSSGRNRNKIRKSRQNRTSSTLMDDDDLETKENQEESEDDSEFISGRKGSQEKKPQENKIASYTEEDDEDDPEVMFSSRKQKIVKKPQGKVSVSCRDDDDDDEDDDDEEFVLSESDFVDEDFEELKMTRNANVSRYALDKRDSQRAQKNSRKPKFFKKPKRPKRRNSRLNSMISSADDQNPRKHLVKRRNKKISSQQKRRTKAESDSDFVSSVSSDHEYAISEEEREQMREAKVYCENLRSKVRSSSRTQQRPTCEQRKPTVGKGKEKIEEMKDEVGKQVCGICLSEEGKRTMRGILDCCRHHFCFSCILEWSKVESRCPLCKQRFTTITMAARSDRVPNSKAVVIPVPERDQIYEPSEEEVRRYLDPYETVICTECHNTGDDAYMLLCDICDSPAHTFCVGLGWEVPEGNWYCNGCTTPRLHTNASHRTFPVAGSFDLNETYVPEMPTTQETHILPEPTVATTLRDRRRIHHQIHHQFLNTYRLSDLISRANGTPASTSSAGIRLFGSRLDQARDSSPQRIITNERPDPTCVVVERTEDQVMPLMREPNLFSPPVNPFLLQVGNSTFIPRDGSMQAELGGSGVAFDSRFGNAQLHPCTNISNIGSDSIPSPYPCREAIGSSRTPQSGLHTRY